MKRNPHSASSGSTSRIKTLMNWSLIGTILSVTIVFITAGLGAWLGQDWIIHFDDRIQQYVYLHSNSRPLFPYISLITAFGSFKISALVAAGFALFFFIRRRPETIIYGYAICASFAMMWILNTLLKEFFRRNRPELDHLLIVQGYSFPSGHAMISMGFYGILFAICAIECKKHGAFKWWLPLLSGIVFIVLLGLSRIMLGVHFPTDVLTGFAAGLVWIICMVQGIKRAI